MKQPMKLIRDEKCVENIERRVKDKNQNKVLPTIFIKIREDGLSCIYCDIH